MTGLRRRDGNGKVRGKKSESEPAVAEAMAGEKRDRPSLGSYGPARSGNGARGEKSGGGPPQSKTLREVGGGLVIEKHQVFG
jgi:hypothetical protein